MSRREEWRPVVEFDGRYEVSDRGRVRSLRYNKTKVTRVLKPNDNGTGYKVVWLGRYRKAYLHRVALEAFVGPCPEGMECRHLNGNREDNRICNLAWGTKAENGRDKVAHGSIRGERNGFSFLTDETVRQMRRLRASGISYPKLGRLFGVHKDTAARACRGKTWSHV